VNRSLNILRQKLPLPGQRGSRTGVALFWWGVVAVVLSFLLPVNVLTVMGLNIFKLLPTTYAALIGGLFALGAVSFHQRCREAPGLMLYIFAIPALGLYSAYWQGFSGTAVYLETYWIAGLLALMLEPASAKQKRILAGILITLCLLNVLVSVQESLTQTNWFPLVIDPDKDPLAQVTEDFRAHGFYSHPLNAALITSMAVYLLYAMRLRFILAAPIFGMLLLSMLAFGGRTALGVTLILSILTAAYLLFRGLLQKSLKLDFVLSISFALVFVPLIIAIVATQTTIADRIMDNLYYDDSAAVRATQWEVLRYLNLRNWLFGIPHVDLEILKYQISLGGKDTDIENCWLLMFLNLGGIGFLVFLVILGAFTVHLGRQSGSMFGWLMIISSMVIDSTSNSLGVRTNDLLLEVAFAVAISGYKDFKPARGVQRRLGQTIGWHHKGSLSNVPIGVHTMRLR
jgi:hypothetical protein